jgi:hypothetical protein
MTRLSTLSYRLLCLSAAAFCNLDDFWKVCCAHKLSYFPVVARATADHDCDGKESGKHDPKTGNFRVANDTQLV